MTAPLCKDCKHLRKGLFQQSQDWKCVSPQNGYHPVDGKPIIHRASIIRDTNFVGCTKQAKFFEAKP